MKFLLAAVALAVLVAGCGSAGEVTVPDQDDQGRYVIHLTAANRFTPMEAKVPVGATVVWVNDGGTHDVTAHDESWSSDDSMPKLQAGQSYEHKFETAGEVDYHCALHASQGMKGTIHVEG